MRARLVAALTVTTFFSQCVGAKSAATALGSSTALERNSWYLPTRDGAAKIYVTEIGSGAPVIFLHGGPGNDFQYVVDQLRPHTGAHRFILFDDRGSLLSPVKADRRDTLTLSNLVDDLEELRQTLGLKKLTLFGHSFGSLLALSYFQAYPDRVERLVLTGAFPPNTTMDALVSAMRPRQKALRERPAIEATLKREGVAGPVDTLTPPQASRRNRIEGLAAINAIDLRHWRDVVGGGVFYNHDVDSEIGATIPPSLDFRSTLTKFPIPITIVQGDCDYIDPGASTWSMFAHAFPKLPITVQVIRRASHYAWVDDPRGFAIALRNGLVKGTQTPTRTETRQ